MAAVEGSWQQWAKAVARMGPEDIPPKLLVSKMTIGTQIAEDFLLVLPIFSQNLKPRALEDPFLMF